MMTVNAMGDACPIPVVKTKKAMETLKAGDVVEVEAPVGMIKFQLIAVER